MSDGWDFSKSDWKHAHPLGKNAENFIYENCDYGVFLNVRGADPCPEHWSYASSSTNDIRLDGQPCPKCWGTGKRVKATIIPMRINQGAGLAQNDIKFDPGYIETWSIMGYLPRIIKPALEDFLFLVEWNIPINRVPTDPYRRVVRITDVLKVKGLIDRFEKEVSFMTVGLKSINVDLELLSNNLPLTVGLEVLERETWQRTSYW